MAMHQRSHSAGGMHSLVRIALLTALLVPLAGCVWRQAEPAPPTVRGTDGSLEGAIVDFDVLSPWTLDSFHVAIQSLGFNVTRHGEYVASDIRENLSPLAGSKGAILADANESGGLLRIIVYTPFVHIQREELADRFAELRRNLEPQVSLLASRVEEASGVDLAANGTWAPRFNPAQP